MSRANSTRETLRLGLEMALSDGRCKSAANVVAYLSGFCRVSEPRLADLFDRVLELDNDPKFAPLLEAAARSQA